MENNYSYEKLLAPTEAVRYLMTQDLQVLSRELNISYSRLKNYRYGQTDLSKMTYELLAKLTAHQMGGQFWFQGQHLLLPGAVRNYLKDLLGVKDSSQEQFLKAVLLCAMRKEGLADKKDAAYFFVGSNEALADYYEYIYHMNLAMENKDRTLDPSEFIQNRVFFVFEKTSRPNEALDFLEQSRYVFDDVLIDTFKDQVLDKDFFKGYNAYDWSDLICPESYRLLYSHLLARALFEEEPVGIWEVLVAKTFKSINWRDLSENDPLLNLHNLKEAEDTYDINLFLTFVSPILDLADLVRDKSVKEAFKGLLAKAYENYFNAYCRVRIE